MFYIAIQRFKFSNKFKREKYTIKKILKLKQKPQTSWASNITQEILRGANV